MSEIPLRPTGETDELGDPVLLRYMTADEIRERQQLNIENTSERLRARRLAEIASRNGDTDKIHPRSPSGWEDGSA